jgi:hypothetical protein
LEAVLTRPVTRDPRIAQVVNRLSPAGPGPIPPAPGPQQTGTARGTRGASHRPGHGSSPPPPQPPSSPPPSGPSGSGGEEEEESSGNGALGKKALIIAFTLLALLINQTFWAWNDRRKEEYKNSEAGKIELRTEQMKEERKLQEVLNEAPSQAQTVSPQAASLSLANGDTVRLRDNASATIQGPATVVFVDSGQKIKRISGGDYKLAIENSGNIAWTNGYDASQPPMSVDDFLTGLKRVHERGKNHHRVRLEVKPGSVINLQT